MGDFGIGERWDVGFDKLNRKKGKGDWNFMGEEGILIEKGEVKG